MSWIEGAHCEAQKCRFSGATMKLKCPFPNTKVNSFVIEPSVSSFSHYWPLDTYFSSHKPSNRVNVRQTTHNNLFSRFPSLRNFDTSNKSGVKKCRKWWLNTIFIVSVDRSFTWQRRHRPRRQNHFSDS